MTADAYRTAADRPTTPDTPKRASCSLVRLNGSACTCKPPGSLWCWWVGVQLGDRWSCRHGGEWVRWRDGGENARWVASSILTCRSWVMGDRHPMTEALALLGWQRKPDKDPGVSVWTPPPVGEVAR